MTAIQTEQKKFGFIPTCQMCGIEFVIRNIIQ